MPMVSDLTPLYQAAGREWNVDPALLQAIAAQESGGTPNPDQAVSPKGASGRMQLMPGTAQDIGVTDTTDPVQNIYGSAKYVSGLLDRYHSPELALAAYNAGPGRVDAYLAGKGTLPAETLAYVPGVTKHYQTIAASAAAAAPPDDPFTAALKSAAQPAATAAPSDPFSQSLAAAQKAATPPPFVPPTMDTSLNPYGITGAPDEFGTPGPAPAGEAPVARLVESGIQKLRDAGIITSPPGQQPTIAPAVEAAKEAFGSAPLGLSPQTDAALVRSGIFNGPNEYNPLKGINRAIINPLAAGADLLMRGGSAAFRGAQELVAQAGADLGMPGLGRAVAMIPEAYAGMVPEGAAMHAPEAPVTAVVPRDPLDLTGQRVLTYAAPNQLAAPANDVFRNPLARSPDAAATPAFVPPGANAPLLPRIRALIEADEQRAAGRPSFVPPEAAQPPNPLSTPGTTTVPPVAGEALMVRSVEDARGAAPVTAPAPETAPVASAAPSEAATQASAERARLLAPAKQGIDTTEYVPGVVPTAADVLGTPEVSITQKRTRQSNETPFAERDEANNNARLAYFDQFAGTPADVNVLKQARAAQAEKDLQTAFQNKSAADPTSVVGMIDSILSGPEGVRPLIQQKLSQVRDTLFTPDGEIQTDPEMLYGARKAIDDMLSKEAAKSEPLNVRVASNLQAVKNALDAVIEPAAPGFDQYLAHFSAASRPIDRMELLQDYQPKIVNGANRNMTFAKFDAMMRNIVADREASGVNAAKSIDPETLDALFNLHADLKRAALADLLARVKGSD